ncbi:DoxX-like family protein [Micromonospora pallida]|uniref:DoxX-like family protein n=1 Tax=Micromonospora pallida TaxID=145854 RepID=A0A1C6SAN8_9ACTN|nr:DoxX family protein [Micromonospora pallida]SCL26567.1 DoxX-like family protein [Micromonospora pallida]
MRIPIVALTVIISSILISVALPKLLGQGQMRDRMTHLGVSAGLTRVIGALELAGIAGLLVGLFWWPLGVAAAVGLTLLLIGAAGYHLRAKDPVPMAVVPVVFAVSAAALAVLHVLAN